MKKVYKDTLKVLIIAVILFLLYRLEVVREIVNLIVISFILSYSLKPIHKMLVEKGFNKKLAAALLILGVAFLFIFTLISLIPNLIKESTTIGKTLNDLKDSVLSIYERLKFLKDNKTMYLLLGIAYDKTYHVLLNYINSGFDKVLKLGENLLTLAVVPIIVYYFLAEYEKINNKFLMLIPIENRKLFIKIGKDIDKVLGRYILSQFMLSILIGVLTFIILLVLKVNYPLLLAIINGVFNIIPYFGPLFGALPAIFMALLVSPKIAAWTIVWLYLLQQLEGDLISPKITGDSVSMHPLVVIILLIIGGQVGGFIGMVLAVPIGVIVKVIYEDLNYYLF